MELLEDLGVNVIEDASNESTDIPSKPNPINVNHVLRQKDQNVKKTTQSCADLDLRKSFILLHLDSILIFIHFPIPIIFI